VNLGNFTDFVAYSRQSFEEGLIRAGFSDHDGQWRGTVTHTTGSTEVFLTLSARFPFTPPPGGARRP
jgi:hypothetical protein